MTASVVELLAQAHLDAVKLAAEYLVAYCDATGLKWGPNPAEKFWHRSPEFHVFEFVIFNLIIYFIYLFSRRFYEREVLRRPPTQNKSSNFDLALGCILMLCWMSQVAFKALRPSPLVQLCWLAMPCHLITLGWCYVFLTKDRNNWPEAVYVATMCSVYHWGPASAAMFPDWGDHKFWLEGPVFLVHHGILVALPFYWAFRYELQPFTWRFALHFTWVAMFLNLFVYTLLSYTSGINVNYMLYPPPKVDHWPFLNTPYYRFYVVALLFVLSTTLWIVLRIINAAGRAILGHGSPKTTKRD